MLRDLYEYHDCIVDEDVLELIKMDRRVKEANMIKESSLIPGCMMWEIGLINNEHIMVYC